MKKFLLIAFLLFAFPAFAVDEEAAGTYEFDKSHTSILFFIDHLGYSKMIGEFHDYDGSFTLDPKNPAASKVDITIKIASVDTDVPLLNEHLIGEKWFNAAQYPEARFVSTNVEVTGEKTAVVHGDFTMMGTTKPLDLQVTFNKAGKFPMGDRYVAGFEVRGKIFRSAFGMMEGLPMVGDEVDLLIQTEGVRKDAKKTN